MLEDLEEAKEVDWRSKFLRLAAAMGGLKKNYFFVGKARSKGTPLDAMEQEAFQQLASRATYNWEGFDALTVATGGGRSRHCVNQQVAMLHGVNTLLVRNNVNCCITAGKLRDECNELR